MMGWERAHDEPWEDHMPRIARAAVAAALAALTVATSAGAAPVCLTSYLIQNTTIPDSHTILFHMKDGTTWRNTLRNSCPDLKWYGFVYVVSGTTEVCENLLAVRTIYTGETCLLGAFTREPPAHS
jgi:hypothetical protein